MIPAYDGTACSTFVRPRESGICDMKISNLREILFENLHSFVFIFGQYQFRVESERACHVNNMGPLVPGHDV